MKIKLLWLLVIPFLFFCSCAETNDASTVELITVKEMQSLLEREKVQLIDVRTSAEFAEGYIDGAINIDFRASNFKDLILKVDKTKPVAVYCGRGTRSGKCSTFMKKAGFTKIYDLDGGITEWKFKGGKVIQEAK